MPDVKGPVPGGGIPTPIAAVREFHYALAQALHDVDHERAGARIEHYWDSDSIHLAVRGILDFVPDDVAPDITHLRRQRLAQALFGAGYLGPVKLLPPHRAEFISQLSRWMRERPDQTSVRSRIEQALRSRSARELDAIVQRTRQPEERREDAVQARLGELATLDSEAFVLVESAWGTWPERLQGLLDTGALTLEESGELVADEDIELLNSFASHIQRVRGGERTIATAMDAAAFVSLSKKVDAARHGEAVALPRFFTSSPQLRALWRSSDDGPLQRALRVRESLPGEGLPAVNYIWRGAGYYYLRASNHALRVGAALTAGDLTTLDELRGLSGELGRALVAGRSAVAELLDHYPLAGDAGLFRAVDNFSSFRMVEIWLGYDGRRDIDDALDNLKSLSDYGADPLVVRTKEALEGQSLDKLRGEIAERDLSIRMLDSVYKTSSAHERIKGRGSLSLNEDLGAVRWGLEYEGLLDSVTLQPTPNGQFTDLISLYDVDKLKKDDSSAERAVAVLLGLEEFDLASRLIDVIGDRPRSDVLDLMSYVASISRRGYQSEDDLSRQLQLLRGWWKNIPESRRPRLVLGYAYALFKLWEYSSRDGAWPGVGRPDNSVAAESLNVVKTYLARSLRDESDAVSDLRLANAVNHVVYVAFSAELVDDEILEYTSELERVARRMDNHRFLDTVGVALLWRARHVVGSDRVAIGLRISLAERSLSHLERATNLVKADQEVIGHKDDAATYLLKLREQLGQS
jgi:hypothetical protein